MYQEKVLVSIQVFYVFIFVSDGSDPSLIGGASGISSSGGGQSVTTTKKKGAFSGWVICWDLRFRSEMYRFILSLTDHEWGICFQKYWHLKEYRMTTNFCF